jgi:hypothetical protein
MRLPKPSPTGIYIAQSSGVFRINGKIERYHVGQTFPAGHPLLAIRPGVFTPLVFGEQPAPRAVEIVLTPEPEPEPEPESLEAQPKPKRTYKVPVEDE